MGSPQTPEKKNFVGSVWSGVFEVLGFVSPIARTDAALAVAKQISKLNQWVQLALLAFTTVVITYVSFFSPPSPPPAPVPSLAARQKQLDDVAKSLNDLAGFVRGQKDDLDKEQKALDGLKRERSALAPIVASERATVDAILAQEASRGAKEADRRRWLDWLIGFWIGVASSLGATGILYLLGRAYLRHKATPVKQPSSENEATTVTEVSSTEAPTTASPPAADEPDLRA